MSDFNQYEYVVSDKQNPSRKWQKVLMILGYIAVDAGLFFLLLQINPFLIALLALTTWVMVFFTWRYLNVEYEYSIVSGILTFTRILGNRSRKEIFSVPVKDISVIAPLGDSDEEIKRYAPEKYCYAVPKLDFPDVCYALLETGKPDKPKKKTVFFFQSTPQSLRILRFYNPSAVSGRFSPTSFSNEA